MNANDRDFYKWLVEEAGGIFVGIQDNPRGEIILFQRVAGGSTIALYRSACRSREDIALALKADAEKFAEKALA